MQGSQRIPGALRSPPSAVRSLTRKLTTAAANKFGSDIYERIGSLQYWDSNQMAHAMMGFVGTTLTALALSRFSSMDNSCWAMAFILLPVWRDIVDYMVDRRVLDQHFSIPFLHRGEVLRDSLTDSSFWLIGVLLAMATMAAANPGSYAAGPIVAWFILVLIVSVVHGITHYKPQKTRFDRSGIPYFVRLAKVKAKFKQSHNGAATRSAKHDARDRIANFLNLDAAEHVMIVTGSDDSGKTTLACGIATEFAVWPKTASAPSTRYVLMGELYSMVRRSRGRYGTSGTLSDTRPISSATAEILFIDEAELTPDKLAELNNEPLEPRAANQEDGLIVPVEEALKYLLLSKRRIVFVIHEERLDDWQIWIKNNLGVSEPPIIRLCGVIDDQRVAPTLCTRIMPSALSLTFLAVVLWWLCALLYAAAG